MNLKQLEDLLLRLQRLAVTEQLRADVNDFDGVHVSDTDEHHRLNRLHMEKRRAENYELAITLREAAEVVQEVVVAKRRETQAT